MEQIQSLQSNADRHSTLQDPKLLPTEMDRQIPLTRIPFRASPRRHVGAHVFSPLEISGAHEP
jgi:hypothetical protein